MGPTATILAADLSTRGYQAIDIGHIDIEYEWSRMHVTHKVPVENKFVNEAGAGVGVGDINDIKYKNEIVCRFLSVIIPVYNVSFYLEECLSSVVHQSLQDIEIICINDGSTDNSLEILKKWGKKDNRIVILNQENKGVSAARNEGLKIAKGNYITFVDADDMVCPNIYSSLIPKMQIYELDAYIFAFKTFPNEKIETIGFPTNRILTWQELFASNPQIQSKNSLCFNWRFIYKKKY